MSNEVASTTLAMMRRAGPALLAAIALALGVAGCGDDDDDGTATTSPTQPSSGETTTDAEIPTTDEPGANDDATEPEEAPADEAEPTPPRLTPDERAAARAVRGYVAALDDRDGEAVCDLLVPGAISAVEFPKDRGDCAASLESSVGYRDPRGLPVWETARVAALPSVELSGDEGKVVVTTVTRFADRDERSIEEDVVYLTRSGDDWLIAKPSSTLYRAVGIAEVPPSVLAPP
jgi:hypothetical protein